MLRSFISAAKDKLPTFITVKRSRMLGSFTSSTKDKLPTFIFTITQSQMLSAFTSSAQDNLLTFIVTVKQSQKLRSFTSSAIIQTPDIYFYFYREQFPGIASQFAMHFCMTAIQNIFCVAVFFHRSVQNFIWNIYPSAEIANQIWGGKLSLFYIYVDKTESLSTCRIFSKLLFCSQYCRQSACRWQHYWEPEGRYCFATPIWLSPDDI